MNEKQLKRILNKPELLNKRIENYLKQKILVKQEHIMHRTPISERSGAEIEFIEMPEYYLKQLEFKKEMEN